MLKKSALSLMLLVVFAVSAEAYGVVKFDRPGKYFWTVPEGVTTIWISAAGGGGGGGGAGTLSFHSGYKQRMGAGGGGAASVLKEQFVVRPQMVLSVTVGSGGRGGSAGDLGRGGGAGKDGGATIIGDLMTLEGGKGARLNGNTAMFPGLSGGKGGGHGKICEGYFGEDVSGGSTLLGWGGRGGNYVSPGYASHGFLDGENGIYGGGGGGGYFWINEPHPAVFSRGGNGGDGVVIVEWSRQETPESINSQSPGSSGSKIQINTQGGDVYIDAHESVEGVQAGGEREKTEELPNLVLNGPEVKWPERKNGKQVYRKLILQPRLKPNQTNGGAHYEIRHNIPDIDEIWIDMGRSCTIWWSGDVNESRASLAAAMHPSSMGNIMYWTSVTKTAVWYEVSANAVSHGPLWEICLSYTKLSDPRIDNGKNGTRVLLPSRFE